MTRDLQHAACASPFNLIQIRGRSFTAGQEPIAINLAMISPITNAYRGIQTAAAGFEKAASDVVKATAPDSKGDLPAAIVGTKTSEIAFKANVAVFKAADKMMGELVDTIA